MQYDSIVVSCLRAIQHLSAVSLSCLVTLTKFTKASVCVCVGGGGIERVTFSLMQCSHLAVYKG